MRWSTKLRRLCRCEKGMVAVMTAVFLTGFIGTMGASVDLGIVYSARAQLQAAAAAAALAAAAELVTDLNDDGYADANYSGAETQAHLYVANNKLLENQLEWTADDTFEAGLWDFDIKDFSRLGDSGDPDDLNAARVTMRRTVKTYFARIVGVDTVDIEVTTTGFLGYAGNGGKGDLPIAVNMASLGGPGQELDLNPENAENVQWTSYDISPTNTPVLVDFAQNPDSIPAMNIGETMYLNNGVETPVLNAISAAFDANQEGGEWHVMIPVVEWSTPSTQGVLRGFVNYVITEVVTTGGDKGIKGHWTNGGDLIMEGAASGGGEWGVRATRATLIN